MLDIILELKHSALYWGFVWFPQFCYSDNASNFYQNERCGGGGGDTKKNTPKNPQKIIVRKQ